MIHWFAIDELKSVVDGDYLIECCDDDHDGTADVDVMEQCRKDAEDFVKDSIKARGDVTQWDVDADNDGISDNIDGNIRKITKDICVYYIACRRIGSDVPPQIQRNYDIADMKLQRIANGGAPFPGTGSGPISGNMTKEDLGKLTEDGSPLPWSDMF